MLLMDSEIWSILHAMFQGIVVNQETLALDVIRSVGPGGSFLGQRHTRQHMREHWQPTLIDRRPYNQWEEKQGWRPRLGAPKSTANSQEYHPVSIDAQTAPELGKIITKLKLEASHSRHDNPRALL